MARRRWTMDTAQRNAASFAEAWRTDRVHKWIAYDRDTGAVVGRGGLSRWRFEGHAIGGCVRSWSGWGCAMTETSSGAATNVCSTPSGVAPVAVLRVPEGGPALPPPPRARRCRRSARLPTGCLPAATGGGAGAGDGNRTRVTSLEGASRQSAQPRAYADGAGQVGVQPTAVDRERPPDAAAPGTRRARPARTNGPPAWWRWSQAELEGEAHPR
jgi:hypothetical protein